jgi:hypothetical protein
MRKSILIFICLFANATLFGQSRIIPIISLESKGVIGGFGSGKWLSYSQVAPAMSGVIDGTDSVKAFDLQSKEISDVFLKAPSDDDRCPGFDQIRFDKESPENGVAFGVAIDWNPIPRKPVLVSSDSTIYKLSVSELLKSKGLAKSSTKISQMFKVDLDNDGIEETLISATNLKKGISGRAEVGDYSFVAVRKLVNGRVKTTVLSGDFIKKSPKYKDENSVFNYANEQKISAIADLNGDGRMEILVFGKYYHGEWVNVFEATNNGFVEIKQLAVGCE